MATINDLYKIRGLLTEVVVHHPQVRQMGAITFGYASWDDLYVATIDSDLEILFDDVEFHSNCIHLMRDGKTVAIFCHIHQRLGTDEKNLRESTKEELTLMTKEDERQLHPNWTWGDDDDQSEC